MFCPHCGKQIEDGVRFCPECGKETNVIQQPQQPQPQVPQQPPVPQKKKKSGWKTALIIIAVIVVLVALFDGNDSGENPKSTEETQLSESAYKAQCQEIDFDVLSRNPDSHKGEYLVFEGEVIQCQQSGKNVTLRVNVTPVRYNGEISYWEDTIYVTAKLKDDGDRILEDDVIRIYGVCDGLYSYLSIFGAEVDLPKISAEYWDLVQAG